jgi:hypothetical protein
MNHRTRRQKEHHVDALIVLVAALAALIGLDVAAIPFDTRESR